VSDTAAGDFLATVTKRRREDVAQAFGRFKAADLERLASCGRPPRDFAAALLAGPAVAIVAEVKKGSPSAGAIALGADAAKQALHYQSGGAAAVSVLTEPRYFAGSFVDLSDVADAVDVPVLCKDFIVDEAQLHVARSHGADAVLLMVSVLGDALAGFMDTAATLGLQSLVEVATADELEAAQRAGARLVAVNARDLHSLAVDVEASLALVSAAKALGMTVVRASGVRSRADVEAAAASGADAVLVGEMLMRAEFPEDVLGELTGVARRPAQA
jgi:indole-3-glycerol phosphate synthase